MGFIESKAKAAELDGLKAKEYAQLLAKAQAYDAREAAEAAQYAKIEQEARDKVNRRFGAEEAIAQMTHANAVNAYYNNLGAGKSLDDIMYNNRGNTDLDALRIAYDKYNQDNNEVDGTSLQDMLTQTQARDGLAGYIQKGQ